ncbi:hypothetical protein [Methylocystis sp.]|uniref:hypothetical protein n=1 Tax=Methylocystis sp. TaxID=1911079 RepID=UPI002734BFC7|nr:hypothetical protein [Methylocystis sp.]MDP3553067.1 hypothetical protein [Methylocystis sp.]
MTRRRLPNRRAGETVGFEFRGAAYVTTFSRFPDDQLAEVFIDCQAKGATPLDCDAKDVAVALSLALQFGTPAEAIRAALTREADGTPVGIAGAVLDLIEGGDQ